MTNFFKTSVGIFLLGSIVGTLIPSPVDPIHFYLINNIIPNITNKISLISWQIFDWYFLDASYFILLLILAYVLHIKKVSTIKKISILAGVLGVGAVIGILGKILLG